MEEESTIVPDKSEELFEACKSGKGEQSVIFCDMVIRNLNGYQNFIIRFWRLDDTIQYGFNEISWQFKVVRPIPPCKHGIWHELPDN